MRKDEINPILLAIVFAAGSPLLPFVVFFVFAAIWESVLIAVLFLVPVMFLFVTLPHAVLGMAVFLVIRRFWQVSVWGSVLAGFFIGAVPLSLSSLTTPDSFTWGSLVFESSFYFLGPIPRGLCGALGGLVFWRAIRYTTVTIGPRADDRP